VSSGRRRAWRSELPGSSDSLDAEITVSLEALPLTGHEKRQIEQSLLLRLAKPRLRKRVMTKASATNLTITAVLAGTVLLASSARADVFDTMSSLFVGHPPPAQIKAEIDKLLFEFSVEPTYDEYDRVGRVLFRLRQGHGRDEAERPNQLHVPEMEILQCMLNDARAMRKYMGWGELSAICATELTIGQ